MAYIIDAFLECAHPYLKVFNRRSGQAVLSFGETEVRSMLESGDLCVRELFSTNPQVHVEIVKQLTLYHCEKSLQQAFS